MNIEDTYIGRVTDFFFFFFFVVVVVGRWDGDMKSLTGSPKLTLIKFRFATHKLIKPKALASNNLQARKYL